MKLSGFTLIELLIVVAIIGILAAIAVPNFLNAQIRAKVARCESELKGLGGAYTMYKMDNGTWPPHIDGDPAQHRFVTTPIAYYSSSVDDIFAEQKQGMMGWTTWFRGQYHAEPGTTHHSRITIKHIYDQTWDVAFFMTSVGPTHEHESNMIYNASNGMQSKGDILYFTRGQNNGKYPFHKR